MVHKLRSTWAEIDLNALENNIKEVVKVSNSKEIIAVIKADGYGHGAVGIYKTLLENGASKFAVAVITEAIELRKAGLELPIIILGYTPHDFYDEIIDFKIEQTIYSYQDAVELSRAAVKRNEKVKIHIAVDTGMSRIGFLTTEEEAMEVKRISELPGIEIEGIFTHFASADERDKEYSFLQIERFEKFNEYLKQLNVNIKYKHVSNSAGVIDFPNLEYNGVRAGIMLYGYYPSEDVDKTKVSLKPVMRFKSTIVHLKTLEEGRSISYGRVFTTERESKIATLPVGYADGLPRLLTGKGKVLINGTFAPIVGRICMDQCMIDVTEVPNVKVGDEVMFIGEDEFGNNISADDIADLIGTISYEIICGISKRVPRVYKKDGKTVNIKNYV